ncbi:MAG TPA: phage tail protein [Blastocatellia bacterium]
MTEEDRPFIRPASTPDFLLAIALDLSCRFQEITGLDTEVDSHYRRPAIPGLHLPRPGRSGGAGNITMRKGIFIKDKFRAWYNEIKLNTVKPTTMTIDIVSQPEPTDKPPFRWTLSGARPTKIFAPDFPSDAQEIAVESVEIAYEAVTVSEF